MNLKILTLIGKLLDIFKKRSKSGEKSQEIENKKLNYFNKYLAYGFLILLSICVLNSIFPNYIHVDSWIFDLLEKILNYMTA